MRNLKSNSLFLKVLLTCFFSSLKGDELNIYDIPIAVITDDFLTYLSHLKKMNVEVASEFILVASTLMRIKAKMLLPRPMIDEEGNEIDPREEFVKHLLEYKKYRSVVSTLSEMEASRMNQQQRGNVKREIRHLSETVDVDAELQDLDLYKMMKVFQKVMKRYEFEQNKPVHQVIQYPYTIEKQKIKLMERLTHSKRLAFNDIIAEQPDKILVIFIFLSILELIQLNLIKILPGEGFNNFPNRKKKGK